jgi:hypothetical protein
VKPLKLSIALGLAALCGSATPARADTAPEAFLKPSECLKLSPPCKCSDAPMMEMFLNDQRKALSSWEDTKDAILTPGGPETQKEAIADFHSRFDPQADPRVEEQFLKCPTINMGKHNPGKIAGVSINKGGAALDDCFCQTFCQDIVEATATHENIHFGFGFVAIGELISVISACVTLDLPAGFCDTLDAQMLADSEIFAHKGGISSLADSLSDLRASDPDNPDMECTWEPLPPVAMRHVAPPPTPPAGFWERVEMLASRFIHGVSGTPS